MSEFQKGDSVLVRGEVIEYIEGVGANVELFSKTDQFRTWVRPDLLCPKGSVVLDITEPESAVAALRAGVKHAAWVAGADLLLGLLADQIEAQTKPPRIPEPGLWGVVEAAMDDGTERAEFVRTPTFWYSHRWDAARNWDSLTNPTLIREGLS